MCIINLNQNWKFYRFRFPQKYTSVQKVPFTINPLSLFSDDIPQMIIMRSEMGIVSLWYRNNAIIDDVLGSDMDVLLMRFTKYALKLMMILVVVAAAGGGG